MFPRLEALAEELCYLTMLAVQTRRDRALTSDVSSPGMASASEVLVNERVGISLVADCGTLISAV